MIELRVDWQDAPGVQDLVLARTWCRLTIKVDGQIVTRAFDQRTRRGRNEVYGSAFPLCRWLIENWWFLQHEAYRFDRRYGSRDLARNINDRTWVQRHSLLAAREGGTLPDLTLFRDGEAIIASWLRDGGDATHPFLRFTNEGRARMTVENATGGLAKFVHEVLERVEALKAPEIEDARREWTAISEATREERELCAWSARLGIDPYDPDELTVQREKFLSTSVSMLDPEIRDDLLDAATIDGLPADMEWIGEAHVAARKAGAPAESMSALPSRYRSQHAAAHENGYECARALRRHLCGANGGAVADMREVMQHLGWAHIPVLTTVAKPSSPIDAALDHSDSGAPVIVVPADDSISQERFRLARSLFLHHFTAVPAQRRLVTGAHTWDQRASRAFAAEFLVPAAVLANRIETSISFRAVEVLADEYQVDPLVIEHQIRNHHLGSLSDAWG